MEDMDDMQTRKKARKTAKKRISVLAKSALFFGVAVVILAGALLMPSADTGKKSGVELFGEKPDAEIYGPELPESTVGTQPVKVIDSPLLPEETGSAEEKVYVYASDDQKCYHLATCKFAFASGHRFTLAEAHLLGYKPCGRCNPPAE